MQGDLRRKLQRGSVMGPYELLGNIVLILERLQIPYIVTGSIASIRRKGQFNIIHPASGLKVDIIIKVDSPFRDITGILKVSEDDVDYGYISEWAERLGLTEIWKAINDRSSRKM